MFNHYSLGKISSKGYWSIKPAAACHCYHFVRSDLFWCSFNNKYRIKNENSNFVAMIFINFWLTAALQVLMVSCRDVPFLLGYRKSSWCIDHLQENKDFARSIFFRVQWCHLQCLGASEESLIIKKYHAIGCKRV